MKKYLIVGLFLLVPFMASAQTMSTAEILQRIAVLQAELQALQVTAQTPILITSLVATSTEATTTVHVSNPDSVQFAIPTMPSCFKEYSKNRWGQMEYEGISCGD